ncbi:primase C-terminal domain-containing protein [Arenimonas sp.]|uniref:primase C-terminal domain-containing protein n=1 Tax=Arenimonas sp. TaxID=1872635 RepID=UPI002E334BC1|nr:primase C-terminal domain-containing protein [Arenimonas sp.]HEX4852756.1 primase C-terminal domain-containing protein [Arenimonas sp.]
MEPQIDTAMTARFLSALSRDAVFTFQTFPEGGRSVPGLKRVLHGSFAKLERKLMALNQRGAGIFVMVNRGDLGGRKASNVVAARALFLDLDGAPVEPVLACQLPPRIVVESSAGKWHCYWPVADLPLGQFSCAQKAIAALFDGDPKVCDAPRVMRLPGFLHCKGEPQITRLESADPVPFTWDEMTRAFDLAPVMRLPDRVGEGDRNSTIFKLARSACQKGVPEAEQLAKALKVNAKFDPPLAASEVESAVRSAYRSPSTGAASLPLAVMDSDAFKALDHAGRMLVVVAYRRADSFNAHRLTLPWSEVRQWFPREETFYRVRDRVVRCGIFQVVEAPTPKAPKKGSGPKPTFYRLAIPPIGVGYSSARIPPIGVGPEALQALGS